MTNVAGGTDSGECDDEGRQQTASTNGGASTTMSSVSVNTDSGECDDEGRQQTAGTVGGASTTMSNVVGNKESWEGDDEGRLQTAETRGGAPRSTIHQILLAHVSSYDRAERFATMTECLGYESITQRRTPTACGDAAATAELAAARLRMGNTRSRMSSEAEEEEEPEGGNFPTPLTTLNANGRPRFEMIKTRENERLTITMEKIVPPLVVKVSRTASLPPPLLQSLYINPPAAATIIRTNS